MLKFFLISLLVFKIHAEELKKEIEINWESAGDFQYRVQLKDESQKILFDEITDKTTFTFTLNEGKFQYRVGVIDGENTIWAEWKNVKIEKKISPTDNTIETRDDIDSSQGQIKIDWEKIPESNFYVFQVRDADKTKILRKKIRDTTISFELPVGEYEYRIGVNDSEETIFGEWKKFKVERKIEPVPEIIPEPKIVVTESKPIKINYDRWSVFWRSALMPGLGHKWRKDKIWHYTLYPILMLPVWTTLVLTERENTNEKEKYDSNIRNAVIFRSIDENSNGLITLSNLFILNSFQSRDKINESYTQGIQLNFLLLGIYIFNLVDALFFHDYSKPVYPEETGFQFQMQYNSFGANYTVGYQFRF
jgi:hypothetical protein